MAKPRVIVLRAAGTNCDFETVRAFELAGAAAERVHVRRLAAGEVSLSDYDILTVPGGFSYGDDIAAGRIFSLELSCRLGDALREFVAAGRLVLGICNGFQVLIQTGLLPGGDTEANGGASLTRNIGGRYEDRWVPLETGDGPCVFTRGLGELELPVAHAEGRFVTDEENLAKMHSRGQIAFRYSGKDGQEPGFPENPNGSQGHVAGICDPTGRVLGMMPHPERFVSRYQHPAWTRDPAPAGGGANDEGAGLALFRNAVTHVAG
jgi:phosphoribosylformylglycinamidine synthase I